MKKFDPQAVSDKNLSAMRFRAKFFSVFATLTAADAVVALCLGHVNVYMIPILVILAGYLTAVVVVRRHLKAIAAARSRVPRTWPPDKYQCPGCGVVDELDYGDSTWTDFFGYKAHKDCAELVWKGWRPPTKQLPGDIPIEHRYTIDCKCDTCKGL